MLAAGPLDHAGAEVLASQLGLGLLPPGTTTLDCEKFDVLLVVSGSDLFLQQTHGFVPARRENHGGRPARGALPGPVRVDFGSDSMRHRRRSGQNELLGRAVGVSARRHLQVLDATAGLGRDSFVLADLGCAVTLCEREQVIAALLQHGLLRARAAEDGWLAQVAQRMRLHRGDVRSLPGAELEQADAIYLDPMFPQRDKRAAVKKEMALFHALLESEGVLVEGDELLRWALAQDVARVVVKRPPRAPLLADQKPSHSLAGKAVRFDVYVLRSLDQE